MANTDNNTFNNPFTYLELKHAAFQCRKNVAWKESVTTWMDELPINLWRLIDQLESGTYKILDPYVFHITDPKPRTVSATHFPDRVVQRSMCNNGVYDWLTSPLIFDNCACQKEKGITFAIDRLEHHLHKYYNTYHTNKGWIVRLDIRKYFPSIPHEILKEKLKAAIPDERVYDMICMVIDNFVKVKFDDDLSFLDRDFGIRGLGLGSQLSQLLALFYLSPLDHYIKEVLHVKHYLRYMDDMILIVKTRAEAEKIFKIIDEYLKPLGLVLNSKSHIKRLDQPFEFLKMIYHLTKTGKVKHRITRKSLNREVQHLNTLIKRFKYGELSVKTLIKHTNTWHGYAKSRASKNQIKFIMQLIKMKM